MACDVVLQDLNITRVDLLVRAHVDLKGHASAVPQARRFVYDALRGTVAEGVLDDALLLTSEIVTNVILHARSDLHLGLAQDDNNVLVTVRDHSPAGPRQRAANAGVDTVPESGRGLSIIASLADDFGWTRLPSGQGKVMWCVLAIAPASQGRDPGEPTIPAQSGRN